MNPSGGSITWNLDANSKGFDSTLKKASKDAKSFGDDVNGIHFGGLLKNTSDALGRVGSALLEVGKKATVAFGAAALAGTGFAVKSAASFEQTRIGLENMLGSADSARNVLKTVSDFAAETPFEFPELANSVKQLVAFGFSGESAVDTMKQLGDVSAAIGTPIGDLSYLMGTLKTQGRAFTIDIRQFAQRGVPIYEYLAKVLKTNEAAITEMIEAGKIGFPEVQRAFAAMTSEGGKFHGAMAKQSKSLSGLFSTLKDNIGQTARELVGITQTGDVREGSLFDILRKSTARLIENLPVLISHMKNVVGQVIDVAKQVGEYLQPKFEVLWSTLSTKLLPVLTRLWAEVLQPLIPILGTILVGAIGLALDALNLLITVASWLGQVIMNVTKFFVDFAGQIVNAAQTGYNGVRIALEWIGDRINDVKNWFNSLPDSIRSAVTGIAEIIIAPFREAFQFISSGVGEVKDAISSVKDTAGGIKSGAANTAQRILDPFKLFHNALGTSNFTGGSTVVGERGPEIVNLPRGSEIIPNHKIREQGASNQYHIGTINISSEVDGQRWLKKLGLDQQTYSNGLVPSQGAI